MSTPIWNPLDPGFRADPYPHYDRLRAEAPAYWSGPDTLVLTRYDDVLSTLRHPTVSRDVEANRTIQPGDPIAARRNERRSRSAKTILNLDPPDHTRLRRLVSKAFVPGAIERLRGRITELVDAALDRADTDGHIELIDDFAYPIPFQVISEMLGIPVEHRNDVRAWSHSITASLEPTATLDDFDAADQAFDQLIPFLWQVVEHRRQHLGDDVISALICARDDGDALNETELIAFIILLYVAGHETTVNLIGNGMLALLRHPGELERWRLDPDLDRHATSELLRFDGPVQHTIRVAMEPMTYRDADGGEIVAKPGTGIITVLGAANHDPAMFDDPHVLRLDRSNAHRHLAFAAGVHYCLGGSLAMMEATIALSRLIRRFPVIELDGEPRIRDRITIRGLDHLPLAVRGA